VRLKQTLLNLTLRMREIYIARGLHDEQLVKAIGEMAGPLRACAATLRELQGKSVPSGKEALAQAANEVLGEVGSSELMASISEARQSGALPAGKSAATFRALLELAQRLWAEAQPL
jgi:hypothetical protein